MLNQQADARGVFVSTSKNLYVVSAKHFQTTLVPCMVCMRLFDVVVPSYLPNESNKKKTSYGGSI